MFKNRKWKCRVVDHFPIQKFRCHVKAPAQTQLLPLRGCVYRRKLFPFIPFSAPRLLVSEGAFSIYIYLRSRVRSKAKHTQKYVYKFNDCQPFLLRKFMIIIFFLCSEFFSASLLVSCYLSSLSQVNIYYIFSPRLSFFPLPFHIASLSPLSHFLRIINSRSLGMIQPSLQKASSVIRNSP